MAQHRTPYEEFHAGEVIMAERMNDMQGDIREDITGKIAQAKDEIVKSGVDRAGNAERFEEKTGQDWTDTYDERYAPKLHNHEGQSVYRRYIKHFTTEPGYDSVLLTHNLHRHPLVDVYELLPVTDSANFTGCKLMFFYADEDADTYGLWKRSPRQRALLGLSFERLLSELGVEYGPTSIIEELIGEAFEAFARDPNDEIKHCMTPWVDECCGQRRTVDDLKRAGQWDDLYLAINPRKSGKGADLLVDGDAGNPGSAVEIVQVNYDTLYVKVNHFDKPAEGDAPPLDLMFLLRI
jgi:hypothetical protein